LNSVAQWLSRHDDIERRERELLLCAAAGLTRAKLITNPGLLLCGEVLGRLEDWAARRRSGEPLAYLVGSQGFLDFDLAVSPAVLIPRPETEILVEQALAALAQCNLESDQRTSTNATHTRLRLLDLGTGSGAIALALARARPDAEVIGADISTEALKIAAANAATLGVEITWRTSSWFATLSGAFDLIVSNPPYIAADDPHLTDLTFEPLVALAGGADGLDAFRAIITDAPRYLRQGAPLAFEHGYDQAEAVADLLRSRGFEDIETHRDLAGIHRVTLGRWRGSEAY
jgi:release factor glutamine methyltransferase